jgi:hypothetical protein
MQPKNRPGRRTLVAGVSLFAILIAIGFLAWERNRDQQDKTPSTNNNTVLSNTTRQEELYPVTIIVIDDFSQPLKELVNGIDERADDKIIEDFTTAGEEIRAMADQKGRSGPDIREEIIGKVSGLKNDIYELVLTSDQMNLDGRTSDSTNCAISPEGTSLFVTEGASLFVTEGASLFVTEGASLFVTEGAAMSIRPHGERVQREFDELLGLPPAQGLDIHWETLDVKGFVFPVIAQELNTKIDEIRAADPRMRIVVNMSFAIVPCDKVTDIAAYTRLLREFVIEEGGDPNNPWAFEQVLKALYQEDVFHAKPVGAGTFQSEFCPDGEAFAACEEYPPGQEEPPSMDRTLYFVAASGNGIKDENGVSLGVEYPFYPAAWKEVISVSANNDADHLALAQPPRAEYSNKGRIMMAGRWLPDLAFWPQGTIQDWQVGTSFAAPRYSFVVALYLTGSQNGGVGCEPDVFPPPADSFDWLVAPPPTAPVDKNDRDHCSTLH